MTIEAEASESQMTKPLSGASAAGQRHSSESMLSRFKTKLALFAKPSIAQAPNAHWDGEHFRNPGRNTKHDAWAALRWLRTRQPEQWPQWVDSAPSAKPAACHSQQIADWRVTYVNHATVLVQIGPWNVLTDPVWSDRVSPVTFAGPKRVRSVGIALDDLPPIHAVLLSHDHYDHLDIRTLMWLHARDKPLIVTGLGVDAVLKAHGIETVAALDWWQSVTLGPLEIFFLPAQHFSGRGARDRNRTLWGSLLVNSSAGALYFAGDTGYGPHFHAIHEHFGAPRLALLPIGAYAPRWFMGPVHMDPADAVRAHQDLQAVHSLGIHFNTFQLTDEAIDAPVITLREELAKQGVSEAHFSVLNEGESRPS
ncbi:MAG: MBL fold metallo-hydrolase [Paraperlucidibaca sp.]